jgi:hypothetical protein
MVRTVAAILVLGLVALPARAQPKISFEENAIVARGLSPGGPVTWLGVARERTDWTSRVTLWQDAWSLADASGQATLDLRRPVPVKAIFIAVDMTTGAVAASSPPAYPWSSEVPFPAAGLTFAADKVSVATLRDSHPELEVLVVRPQVGAWRATVRHDDAEHDPTPGVLVTFSDLSPWGPAPPSPGHLRPGDVIVAINPNTIEWFARQLGAGR